MGTFSHAVASPRAFTLPRAFTSTPVNCNRLISISHLSQTPACVWVDDMAEARHGDFVQGSSSQPYATSEHRPCHRRYINPQSRSQGTDSYNTFFVGHHIHQAPVHNVGQALNANSGENKGKRACSPISVHSCFNSLTPSAGA